MSRREPLAIQKCAEWLAFCLSIGWKKEQLDALEKVWWDFHTGADFHE
jgi:hypothetical protein